jgi:outer membrane protein TolC
MGPIRSLSAGLLTTAAALAAAPASPPAVTPIEIPPPPWCLPGGGAPPCPATPPSTIPTPTLANQAEAEAWKLLTQTGPPPAQVTLPPSDGCPPDPNVQPIDLATALRLADADNPAVGVARARIQEAIALQLQARVLWLPNLFVGGNPHSPLTQPMFYHHDGRIQSSAGRVFDVTRNSFFFSSGVVADFPVGEAFFAPLVARRGVRAAQANARAASLAVQREAAETYLDLLQAYARMAILNETVENAELFLRNAEAAAEAQTGKTPADVTRARAELRVRQQERINLRGEALVISARLAELLLLPPALDLRPAELAIVPVTLVPVNVPVDRLVEVGLMNRPELVQYRELVQIALTRKRQAQVEPLVPRVQLAYYGGTFGGGTSTPTITGPPLQLGGTTDVTNFGGRNDLYMQASWELRNMGLGNRASVLQRQAQLEQASWDFTGVQARVSAEVVAAAHQVIARGRTLKLAQEAVYNAYETFRRLREASFGLGTGRRFDPLEALTAEQALTQARDLYLDEVIGYNKAQFRLYAALGHPPLGALPCATTQPVTVPVVPASSQPTAGEAKP